MKIILFLGLLASLTSAGSPLFNMDFIKGFDEGIKLKENDDPYAVFECPAVVPSKDGGPLKPFTTVYSSAKNVMSLIREKNIESILKTLDVFVKSLNTFVTVFADYPGDEFCQGLIFGKEGAFMLVQVATAMSQI